MRITSAVRGFGASIAAPLIVAGAYGMVIHFARSWAATAAGVGSVALGFAVAAGAEWLLRRLELDRTFQTVDGLAMAGGALLASIPLIFGIMEHETSLRTRALDLCSRFDMPSADCGSVARACVLWASGHENDLSHRDELPDEDPHAPEEASERRAYACIRRGGP